MRALGRKLTVRERLSLPFAVAALIFTVVAAFVAYGTRGVRTELENAGVLS